MLAPQLKCECFLVVRGNRLLVFPALFASFFVVACTMVLDPVRSWIRPAASLACGARPPALGSVACWSPPQGGLSRQPSSLCLDVEVASWLPPVQQQPVVVQFEASSAVLPSCAAGVVKSPG